MRESFPRQVDKKSRGPQGECEMKSLSRVRLFVTPWTVAHQAPLSMGFSRQEYCNGLPFPSPGDLPGPGIKPRSLALRADALGGGKDKLFVPLHSLGLIMYPA